MPETHLASHGVRWTAHSDTENDSMLRTARTQLSKWLARQLSDLPEPPPASWVRIEEQHEINDTMEAYVRWDVHVSDGSEHGPHAQDLKDLWRKRPLRERYVAEFNERFQA